MYNFTYNNKNFLIFARSFAHFFSVAKDNCLQKADYNKWGIGDWVQGIESVFNYKEKLYGDEHCYVISGFPVISGPQETQTILYNNLDYKNNCTFIIYDYKNNQINSQDLDSPTKKYIKTFIKAIRRNRYLTFRYTFPVPNTGTRQLFQSQSKKYKLFAEWNNPIDPSYVLYSHIEDTVKRVFEAPATDIENFINIHYYRNEYKTYPNIDLPKLLYYIRNCKYAFGPEGGIMHLCVYTNKPFILILPNRLLHLPWEKVKESFSLLEWHNIDYRHIFVFEQDFLNIQKEVFTYVDSIIDNWPLANNTLINLTNNKQYDNFFQKINEVISNQFS